jgi:hypothetical protein
LAAVLVVIASMVQWLLQVVLVAVEKEHQELQLDVVVLALLDKVMLAVMEQQELVGMPVVEVEVPVPQVVLVLEMVMVVLVEMVLHPLIQVPQ